MEEWVGQLWHRCRQALARDRHPQAAVDLAEHSSAISLVFRACGGEPGLNLLGAPRLAHHSPKLGWQHSDTRRVELAFADAQALHLPARIDLYPQRADNRRLYDWLAALCAVLPQQSGDWLRRHQMATLHLLGRYRGLAQSYEQLLKAELQRRPALHAFPATARAREEALRQALLQPGSVSQLPDSPQGHLAQVLWTLAETPATSSALFTATDDAALSEDSQAGDRKRRHGQYEQKLARRGGLLIFRPESIFSWSEYAPIDHEQQDNEDEDLAAAADDLDHLSLHRDPQSIAKALRMELDVMAATQDPISAPIAGSIEVDEWNYRQARMQARHCRIIEQEASAQGPEQLPEHLQQLLRQVRLQMARLQPDKGRIRGLLDGELDIDACILQRSQGEYQRQDCHQQTRPHERDIATLILVDHSLSTEASLNQDLRIIDVIRDSLLLFAESIVSLRDRLALYAFCSQQRHAVHLSALKPFAMSYGPQVRQRIQSLQPAHYTRMGAALRYATEILAEQKQKERLLLLITDGKPNDSDSYEGRYGVEDTRHAVLEARQRGLRPFCITVDQDAGSYLPHIFGRQGYILIRQPADLPRRLPLLYAQMTR